MPMNSIPRVQPKAHLGRLQRMPHPPESREGFELLDRNERSVDFSPEVMRQLRRLITAPLLRAYPEPERLYQRLAGWLGLPRERLLITMGADGALKAIFEVFVEPGDDVVLASPSFAMYPIYGQMYGARLREARFHDDLSLPLEEILAVITARTKLVVLANPNQPVERAYHEDEIGRLVDACARVGAMLVMDEAYAPFCPYTATPFLDAYPNLIVVRSFSKAFGVAGLRLGYCLSHPEHITHLNSVRPLVEMHAVGIAMGCYLVDHPELMTAYVAEVNAARGWLGEALRQQGFEASGRWANWVLVALPSTLPAPELAVALKQRGVLIRTETRPPLTNHLRITIGSLAQAQRFLAVFEAVVADRQGLGGR